MALREEQRHWDQEVLRPRRWSWLRPGRRRKAPVPFEDQDLFDGFVGTLRAKIHTSSSAASTTRSSSRSAT